MFSHSFRCSAVPTGLGCSPHNLPSVETLGLVQSSLRDCIARSRLGLCVRHACRAGEVRRNASGRLLGTTSNPWLSGHLSLILCKMTTPPATIQPGEEAR